MDSNSPSFSWFFSTCLVFCVLCMFFLFYLLQKYLLMFVLGSFLCSCKLIFAHHEAFVVLIISYMLCTHNLYFHIEFTYLITSFSSSLGCFKDMSNSTNSNVNCHFPSKTDYFISRHPLFSNQKSMI